MKCIFVISRNGTIDIERVITGCGSQNTFYLKRIIGTAIIKSCTYD